MRIPIALALLCAPACAAPIPEELRTPPVEKETQSPENRLAHLQGNKFLPWPFTRHLDMPLRPVPDDLANGATEPKK